MLAPASTLSPFSPHPISWLPTTVAWPQLTRTQSRTVSRTTECLTSALTPSDRPCTAREMSAPSITVPRPPLTRMPYQAPRVPWDGASSTGCASVPFTTRVPSTMSSTRRESVPERSASSGAASTRTPGSMISSAPQPTVTSPVST